MKERRFKIKTDKVLCTRGATECFNSIKRVKKLANQYYEDQFGHERFNSVSRKSLEDVSLTQEATETVSLEGSPEKKPSPEKKKSMSQRKKTMLRTMKKEVPVKIKMSKKYLDMGDKDQLKGL